MADPAPREKFLAIIADDADRFLPAVLQRVEPQRGHLGRTGRADHAKNAALFAQLVTIGVEERVG